MAIPNRMPRLPFHAETVEMLRQAGRAARGGQLSADHLRRALDQTAPPGLPPTVLHLDPSARAVLERARQHAAQANATCVSRERIVATDRPARHPAIGTWLIQQQHLTGSLRRTLILLRSDRGLT